MQLRLAGKLTQADMKDVQRMSRSKLYWPKFIAKNWYGILLVGAITWATVAAIVERRLVNWKGLALLWLVIAAIVAWSFYSTRKSLERDFVKMNARLPETLILGNNGVELELPAGAQAFYPWQSFNGWREGERVLLLEKPDQTFLMVSVAELAEGDRETIRQLLRGSISPTAVPTLDRA